MEMAAMAMALLTDTIQYTCLSVCGGIQITTVFLKQASCTLYLHSTLIRSHLSIKNRNALMSTAIGFAIGHRWTTRNIRMSEDGHGMCFCLSNGKGLKLQQDYEGRTVAAL